MSIDQFASALQRQADAEKVLQEAELAVLVTRAAIESQIRRLAEKKPTENAIAQQVILNEQVQSAEMHVIECRYTASQARFAAEVARETVRLNRLQIQREIALGTLSEA